MPHKHKRKADSFDLAPSSKKPKSSPSANPTNPKNSKPKPKPKPKSRSRKNAANDDTPKSFARLMAFAARGKGVPSALDNGRQPRSKRNATTTTTSKPASNNPHPNASTDTAVTSESQPQPQLPKILPGEKLSDFAQRVNQALPLTGIARSGKKIDGLKLREGRVTRHSKKLQRLQEGWRQEEARLRDKSEELRELAEEEDDEMDAMWEDKTLELPASEGGQAGKGKKKKRGRGKRKLMVGEVDDGDDDWKALEGKREQRKGIHDVVKAPPEFKSVPREVFKVKNGARVNVGNVPGRVGSLRRREELGEERQTIIDTYRKIMEGRRRSEN